MSAGGAIDQSRGREPSVKVTRIHFGGIFG